MRCAAHLRAAVPAGGLAGGVGVSVGERRTTVLAPLAPPFPPPESASGTTGLVRDYLRFLGPATPAEVAAWLGTAPAVVRTVWPADLAEVSVAGHAAWLPADALDALLATRAVAGRNAGDAAAQRGLVRLLPPGDPFLQARDRSLLVPESERRHEIWRPVGGPGALLAGSRIAGTWRARAAGRRVEGAVTPFEPLAAAVRERVAEEAATVAEARGATGSLLRFG
ncbi:DNA glycosylase AlkZ-like family protein [Streptomyces sp. SM12]|uniref:DNA glycosylase AlkZ-like family protein n=1 Tax=Streptomyces sp. SM12 TaxID=1071602 RepID=UPI001C674F29|nr:crosslink repair DNA glycosylase YcaQ family protein [Streptomyces sp. SM12]